MVNGVPREAPRPNPMVLVAGLSRGTPFTSLNPRLFHIMSFFDHPGLVKRDFTMRVSYIMLHLQIYIGRVNSQYNSPAFPKNVTSEITVNTVTTVTTVTLEGK